MRSAFTDLATPLPCLGIDQRAAETEPFAPSEFRRRFGQDDLKRRVNCALGGGARRIDPSDRPSMMWTWRLVLPSSPGRDVTDRARDPAPLTAISL